MLIWSFHMKDKNKGFIAAFYGFAFRTLGVVIMMNDDAAWGLMKEIRSSAYEDL